MSSIPCFHAISCIFFYIKNAEDFVNDCYKREGYHRAYSSFIPPFVGERHWPRIEQELDPPTLRLDQACQEKIGEKIHMKTLRNLGDWLNMILR